MADGNEDLRADDLPGPAYEGYESMELACPAERSGHVAVGDGRHMFVWGGYKVSGRAAAAAVVRLVPESGSAGRPERPPGAPRDATLPVRAFFARSGVSSPVPQPVPTRLGCCHASPPLPKPAPPPGPAPGRWWKLERYLGEGALGGARPRACFILKGWGGPV